MGFSAAKSERHGMSHAAARIGKSFIMEQRIISAMSFRSLRRPSGCSPISQTCSLPFFLNSPAGTVTVPARRAASVRKSGWRP
jgi:hypothetical protein